MLGILFGTFGRMTNCTDYGVPPLYACGVWTRIPGKLNAVLDVLSSLFREIEAATIPHELELAPPPTPEHVASASPPSGTVSLASEDCVFAFCRRWLRRYLGGH